MSLPLDQSVLSLNPPDLVDRVPELVEGYPDRLIPKNDDAAEELKTRTLTTSTTPARRGLTMRTARWRKPRAGAPERSTTSEILARVFRLNQNHGAAD